MPANTANTYKNGVCRVRTISHTTPIDPYTHIRASTPHYGSGFFLDAGNGKVAIITTAFAVRGSESIFLDLLLERDEELTCLANVKWLFGAVNLALLELDNNHPNAKQFQQEMSKRALRIYNGGLSVDELKLKTVTLCGFQPDINNLQLIETSGSMTRFREDVYNYPGYNHLFISITNRTQEGFEGSPLLIKENDDSCVIGVFNLNQAPVQTEDTRKIDGEHSVIPWFYLKLLLDAYANGKLLDLRGVGRFPAHYQDLKTQDHRDALGMRREQTGVLIYQVPPNSILHYIKNPSNNQLLKGDVILKVDGQPVDNEGYIYDAQLKLRIELTIYLSKVKLGTKVTIEFGRPVQNGNSCTLVVDTISVPILQVDNDFYLIQERITERHYFAGGVVFFSLTRAMVSNLIHERDKSTIYLNDWFHTEKTESTISERIVAYIPVIHPLTTQIPDLNAWCYVTHVNDTKVRGLYHLRNLIDNSRDKHPDQGVKIQVTNKSGISSVHWLKHFTIEEEQKLASDRQVPFPLSNMLPRISLWKKVRANLSTIAKMKNSERESSHVFTPSKS